MRLRDELRLRYLWAGVNCLNRVTDRNFWKMQELAARRYLHRAEKPGLWRALWERMKFEKMWAGLQLQRLRNWWFNRRC